MRASMPGGWWTAAVALLTAVTVVVVGLTLAGRMPGSARPSSSPAPSATGPAPVAAPSVLAPAPTGGPQPDDAGLRAALAPVLALPAVGGRVGVAVVDVATGRLLYGREPTLARTPASTAKLLTALAALEELGPDRRLRTTVVAGAQPGQVVLVGGGDPTLTASPAVGGAPAFASLSTLADRAARALRAAGASRITLGYDAGAFAAPAVAPTWPPGYLTGGVVAPVTALSVDEGRTDGPSQGSAPRVADPAAAAAKAFAAELARRGVSVAATPVPARAPAPPSTASTSPSSAAPSPGVPLRAGAVLAQVESPPLAELVRWLLTTSDNDLAEALAHHVALASGRTADFAGAAAAVTAAVAAVGLPTAGLRILDGSGLSTASTAPPELLARALALAADPGRPGLRPVLSGLPIAGFTGTLDDRFSGSPVSAGAGLVRAKTGTLTGVGALAGVVVDADGRLLAFALLADRVPAGAALENRAALDRAAAVLAGCGCRSAAAAG